MLLQHPQLAAQPNAQIWFVGDLVNRGPRSLATLRRVIELGDRAVTVLGNHDLHLLAVAAGTHAVKPTDTITDILHAPDADDLINWLRTRPLAHYAHGHLMVHAGVLPQWTVPQTRALAREVEAVLSGDHWKRFLTQMYGNEPTQWDDTLTGVDRLRVIVNALTRMRFCTAEGVMEFDAKEGLDSCPPGYMPWFNAPNRQTGATPVVAGHWSALGLLLRDDVLALDTGCVWGRKLTALRLNDRRVVQIDCASLSGTRQPAGLACA